MRKQMKHMFMLGLGAAVVTKETVEKVVKSMVDEGQLPKKEAKRLAKNLLAESNRHRKRLTAIIQKESSAIVKKMGPASRREMSKISKRLKDLETRVSKSMRTTGKRYATKVRAKVKAIRKKK